jgi:hypothetical protein
MLNSEESMLQVTAVDPDPDAFPIVYTIDSVVFHKHSSTIEQVKKTESNDDIINASPCSFS